MTELSKTARQSMGKAVKEVHVETAEEAIHAIRVNRAASLFVGDMSRIDKLLEAFDKVVFASGELTNALNEATGKLFTFEKELTEQLNAAAAQIDSLQTQLTTEKYAVKTLAEATAGLLKRAEAAEESLRSKVTVVMAEVDNSERPGDG